MSKDEFKVMVPKVKAKVKMAVQQAKAIQAGAVQAVQKAEAIKAGAVQKAEAIKAGAVQMAMEAPAKLQDEAEKLQNAVKISLQEEAMLLKSTLDKIMSPAGEAELLTALRACLAGIPLEEVAGKMNEISAAWLPRPQENS